MKKLYYVRHGESEANVKDYFAVNTPLTERGRQQAKDAANQAKSLNIDYIISSPLPRAHDTAKIIAKGIGYPLKQIHVSKLFMERDYSGLEGMRWSPDLDMDGFSDIETVDNLLERSKLAFEFLQNVDAKNVLVVSHGAFGRALRHWALNIPYSEKVNTPEHLRIPNAEIINWI